MTNKEIFDIIFYIVGILYILGLGRRVDKIKEDLELCNNRIRRSQRELEDDINFICKREIKRLSKKFDL